MNLIELCAAAFSAAEYAYAPYSGFRVGAALLTSDGQMFSGCNIENAAYPAAMCAERTAVFKAVSEGARTFRAIAVAAYDAQGNSVFAPPCGLCRQVLGELCGDGLRVILCRRKDGKTEMKEYTAAELLPFKFTLSEN